MKGQLSATNVILLFAGFMVMLAFMPMITSFIDDLVTTLLASPDEYTVLVITIVRFIPYAMFAIIFMALVVWSIPRRNERL
jgi:hypothetical protein